MFTRSARLFFLVVLLGVVAAGCGGGGGASTGGETATKQLTESPGNVLRRQVPPAKSGPLDPLAEQLEEAGFGELQPQPGGGNHVAADLSGVSTGGDALFDVYYYDDPSYARREGKRVEGFLDERPGYGLVDIHGHYLISMSGQSKMTASDKRDFKTIVKASMAAKPKE